MNVDFSILNQKGSPAIYADALAQRPAAGFAGRIFVDTDSPSTGIYRDTGTAWEPIADIGGVALTPTLQQVTTAGAASTIPTVFGSGSPSANTQLYVNDIAPYNGNNWATFFVNKDNILPGSGAIINGPAYSPIGARFVNTLTANTNLPNGVSSWGGVYAGSEYNLAGFTLSQTQSSGIRLISSYKSQNVFTGTPGTLSHLGQFWASPLYDPTLGLYNGTVSNVYGFYVSNLTEQAPAIVLPNRFAFFQAGVLDANVFFGKVSVGTDVLTAFQHNVAGSAQVTGSTVLATSPGSQVSVGTAAPNASAVLQADSTTQGFLPPRMTSAQRNAIAAPADGLLIYNTNEKRLDHYGNGAWQQLADTNDLVTWMHLQYNSIPDYVVVGGAGVQDLGAGTTGMFASFNAVTDRNIFTSAGSDYVFDLHLITHEQYGGVAINIGCKIVYSSSTASASVTSNALATYVGEFGTNFAIQHRTFQMLVPKTLSGQPVTYFKVSVVVERVAAGNTSIIGSTIAFNYV